MIIMMIHSLDFDRRYTNKLPLASRRDRFEHRQRFRNTSDTGMKVQPHCPIAFINGTIEEKYTYRVTSKM